MKNLFLLLKIIVFTVVFFLLTVPVAFMLKDDVNSYSRVLTHEFYSQDNIDILFCGASHVSHGIDAHISDKAFGKNTFSTGTPSQGINGTYAIIQQALKSYKPSKIYLECDFAIVCRDGENPKKMGTADFIVSEFLRDSAVKTQFILENSSPTNLLNAFLPIGKDKRLTLNPKKFLNKCKSLLNGYYFEYKYSESDAGYAGKGCVLNYDVIADGTFSNNSSEPEFKPVSEYWKSYIERICDLCKENNVELVFYSMPGSDFYLHEKGNYDDFYFAVKDFLSGLGYEYYDFNLCKPDFAFADHHYSDDNHFNQDGVARFSQIFCDFFTGKVSASDMFYDSYAEKVSAQNDTIYGLIYHYSDDKKTLLIEPVKNHVDSSRITYDVYALCGNEEITIAEKSNDSTFVLPSGKSGKIRVVSYIDGVKQNDCIENFAAF
ncbi:MAG: hypothetical protein IKO57_09465 [Treponema sp.]|nr:hypothetical protein [Treponema sp.]